MIVAAKCAGSRNEVGKIGNMRPCCRARTHSNFPETPTVAAITSATTAWTAALAPQGLKQKKTEWRQTDFHASSYFQSSLLMRRVSDSP